MHNDEPDDVTDETISSDLKKNKNLVVSIENTNRTRSVAREYFGMLKDSEKNIIVDKFHVYCKICFMHSDKRKIYRYKKTVSTGNLLAHLMEEHNIKSTYLSEKGDIKRFFQSPRPRLSEQSKSLKTNEKKKRVK